MPPTPRCPEPVHTLIPGAYGYLRLHGKGTVRLLVEIRLLMKLTLKSEDDSGLSGLAQSNDRDPLKCKREAKRRSA